MEIVAQEGVSGVCGPRATISDSKPVCQGKKIIIEVQKKNEAQ